MDSLVCPVSFVNSDIENMFQFESATGSLVQVDIRVEDGELLFRASDVAKALGYENDRKFVELLQLDNVLKRDVTDTLGRVRQVPFLTEEQLYEGLMLSRAKNVAKFRKWVCSVVLPSIRKTGSYGITQPQTSLPNFLDPAESAMAWAEQYRAKQLAESEATQARLLLEAQAPKVEAYERFMDSDGLLSMNDTAKILGTGRNTLFEELRSAGVFAGTSPKQCYVSQGYFVVKATTNANWSGAVARVTPRGMEWLARGKWKI